MDFEARLRNAGKVYDGLELRRHKVQDNDRTIANILERVKRDLDLLAGARQIDPGEREVRLLKCEKNIQKALALIASQANVQGAEGRKKQNWLVEEAQKGYEALRLERRILKGQPAGFYEVSGRLSAGNDERTLRYRSQVAGLKGEREKAQVALQRGLDIVEPRDPVLDRMRSHFQEQFTADAAPFHLPVDPYSSELVFTPAKFDMVRQLKTNAPRVDLEQFSPEDAVGKFIAWAKKNPNEAQYFLEDVAPLAVVTKRTEDYFALIAFVKKEAKPIPFAPKQPAGLDLQVYSTAEAFRAINEGVKAGDARSIAWFQEWGLGDQPLREFDTKANSLFLLELKRLHRAMQPIQEAQIKEAEKGSRSGAKKVYERLVEQAKGQQLTKDFSPAKLGYDVHKWPWGSWFSSIFHPKSAGEAILRLGLAGACALGAVGSVGGAVALIVLGPTTFGVTPLLGWLLLPVGMAATAAIYGYGSDLIDRIFWEPKPKEEAVLSEKGRHLVRKRLSNKLYGNWIKSGYIHTFPKAKKGSYREEVAAANYDLMKKRFELRLEERQPDDANLYLTPYEVVKAHREIVEEFAFEHKIRSKAPSEQKEFEMAVNRLVAKELKEELKLAVDKSPNPESF